MFSIDALWHVASAELLSAAVCIRPLRRWLLARGEQELYQQYVIKNDDKLPARIQELRCKALGNVLHAVDRALADGRIAPRVRRSIVKTFIGELVTGEAERTQPFRESHGANPPTFLTISPTKRCNLRCSGCYAASSAENDNTLAYSTFSRILADQRKEWGSHFTVISGGEPLMYRSEGRTLLDVLRENPDQYFTMYTNGTLIDDEMAAAFAEIGNITPAISVEGMERETDARRGRGVYQKILRAMEALRNHGVPFGISITATRENAGTILSDELIDFYFKGQGAIYGWIFQYMPIGRSFTVDLMVTPEQRKIMLEQELHLINDRDVFLIDFWNGGPLSLGCISAGRAGGYFYIDWNGNIAPCVFFPYHIANIDSVYAAGASLSSVLDTPYFQSIRKWQEGYLRDDGKVHNLFHPCPMRDHYQFAWETIQKHGPQPMDEEAAKALADPEYRRRMIEYDGSVAQLLDPLWEKEIYARENPPPKPA